MLDVAVTKVLMELFCFLLFVFVFAVFLCFLLLFFPLFCFFSCFFFSNMKNTRDF